MAGLLTRIGVGLGLLAVATACGATETTVDSASPTTELSTVPLCAAREYSPPMSAVSGVVPSFPAEPNVAMLEVLESYGRDHPEAWAGLWLTPTDGADNVSVDNVSVGIVGDVEAHEQAILSLRPQSTDVQMIQPHTSVTDTTTIAESSFELVVVPLAHTLAELRQMQAQISDDLRAGVMPLELSSISAEIPTNIVRVGMPNVTEESRGVLAERYDARMICVEQMSRASTGMETTDTTMGTLIRD